MRGLITFLAAAAVLAGCDDGEDDSHRRNASCIRQRSQAASSPGQPSGEWPVYIDVSALDACTGETYGPLVEDQLVAIPEDREDLESRFVALRVIDVLTVAAHPDECESLLACATGNMQYTVYGDCLATSGEADVQDEAENLLGCEGSLADRTTQVVCADYVRSAILTTTQLCY